jgi:hypothetical protein
MIELDPDLVLRPIIGTFEVLKIGDRRVGMRDNTGASRPQPFYVLRESTFEEWLDRATKQADIAGSNRLVVPEITAEMIALAKRPDARFYEISTD